jgi:hypothetical protein
MAVDEHPSRRPSPPRKPPATSTTAGTINKMPAKDSGQTGVDYGARHEVQVKNPNKSEMGHHFTSSEGRAPKAGREEPQEGPKGRAGKVGDENSADEPG